MRRTLTQQERASLEVRVAEAEARTEAQLMVAVIERCDAYPELPWKAFAVGASAASRRVAQRSSCGRISATRQAAGVSACVAAFSAVCTGSLAMHRSMASTRSRYSGLSTL